MIRVEGLYKSFESKTVLSDINVVFEAGKVNLIIGKSGSGKTVLLKSLIGLHTIERGHIFYGDRDISNMSARQLKAVREEIGVVFQGGALFDSLSVLENVKFVSGGNQRGNEKAGGDCPCHCVAAEVPVLRRTQFGPGPVDFYYH